MYLEPVSVLEHRLEDLVLELADRYLLPYSLIRERCRGFIDSLLECWIHSLEPHDECRL